MIVWNCPKCKKAVLKYVGPNEKGPKSGEIISRKDWELLDMAVDNKRGPRCKCGSPLQAMSEHIGETADVIPIEAAK